MQISICTPDNLTSHEGLLVVPVSNQFELIEGMASIVAEHEGCTEVGVLTHIGPLEGYAAHSCVMVGVSDKPLTANQYRELIQTLCVSLQTMGLNDVASLVHKTPLENANESQATKWFLNTVLQQDYTFTLRSKPLNQNRLDQLSIVAEDSDALNELIHREITIADAQHFCRDLANTPSNICNPSYILAEARQLEEAHKTITVNAIDDEQAIELGMGAFASVSQGSDQPGYIVLIEYRGAGDDSAPLALVGKGITFDTGGNNIKMSAAMYGMKYDMGGAAAVLATMKLCADLQLKINVVGALVCAENMINGSASRPGDIVTTMSGKTVEVFNTDAEGRLVLCDAMTYVQREYKPKALIDVATLTGAAVSTFGAFHTPYFSNNDDLAAQVKQASDRAADPAWHMPVGDEYLHYIKSQFADFGNARYTIDGKLAVAACYLQQFIENNTPWVHMDIAGTSVLPENGEQASGRPVPLFAELLMSWS